MIAEHRITYGGGNQTVKSIPLDGQSRPTSVAAATYVIEDLGEGDDSTSTRYVHGSGGSATPSNATVDATTTTTTAVAGPGSNALEISLSSSTGFVQGRTYLIQSADGRRELFVAEGVTSGKVFARFPLGQNYASGSTIKGVEISGTFPAAQANDEDSADLRRVFRITWNYTIDGTALTHREVAWVIRSQGTPRVTAEDLLAVDPTLREKTGPRFKLEPLIAAAWQDYEAQILASGVDVDRLHTPVGQRAVLYRVLYMARLQMNELEKADEYRAESEKFMQHLLAGRVPARTVYTDRDDQQRDGGSLAAFGFIKRL
jgi:hypothetical protein